jgi:hypothetical protein
MARVNPLGLLLSNSALAVHPRAARLVRASGRPGPILYMHDAVLAEHMAALDRFFRTASAAGAEARLVPIDLTVRLGPHTVARYRHLEREAVVGGIPVWSL